MTGIFKSVASFASIIVFERNSATLMSLTVWNRPVWWSNNKITVSDASRSAAPPPVGNTLERCAGLPVCASALEVGDRTNSARAAVTVHVRVTA